MTDEQQIPIAPAEHEFVTQAISLSVDVQISRDGSLEQVANDNEERTEPLHSEITPVPSLYAALGFQRQCPYIWWES